MSSVPARYEVSGERRKPKPSGSTSSVPSPKMLSPFFACCLQHREDQVVLAHPVGALELHRVGDLEQFGDVLGFEFGQLHGADEGGLARERDGGRGSLAAGAAAKLRSRAPAWRPGRSGGGAVYGAVAVPPSARAEGLQDTQDQRIRVQRLLSTKAVSCDFDSAPTFCACGLPSLNSISVGMPRMPNLRRRARVGVDVELGDRQLAGVLLGHVLEDRGDHLAGAAPFGPVVDEHRRRRLAARPCRRWRRKRA